MIGRVSFPLFSPIFTPSLPCGSSLIILMGIRGVSVSFVLSPKSSASESGAGLGVLLGCPGP